MCNKDFIRTGTRQLYCGSYKRKEGCSWKRHRENNKKADKKYRELHPESKEERTRILEIINGYRVFRTNFMGHLERRDINSLVEELKNPDKKGI